MSDAVVARLNGGAPGEKLFRFVNEHKLLVTFVFLESLTLVTGIALDQLGKPILAGVTGSAAILIPVVLITIGGFLKLLKVIAPYLRTVQ